MNRQDWYALGLVIGSTVVTVLILLTIGMLAS